MIDHDLMGAFAFDEQDLEANRRHRFSARQRNQLVAAYLRGLPLFMIIAMLMAVVSSLALRLTLAEGMSFFLIAVIGFLALFAALTGLQLLVVHSLRGVLILHPQDPYTHSPIIPSMVSDWQGALTGDYFQVYIDQEPFYISSRAFQVLKPYEGRECTVYFMIENKNRVRQILSLEIA